MTHRSTTTTVLILALLGSLSVTAHGQEENRGFEFNQMGVYRPIVFVAARGGGVGAAFVSGNISGSVDNGSTIITLREDDDVVLAYQLMTGFAFKLDDRVLLDVGYRLWNSQDPTFGTGSYDSPLIHIAEIGVRFRF